MHAWIRSTLIVVAALSGIVSSTALAEDLTAPKQSVAPMQVTANTQPAAAGTNPSGQSAQPEATAPGDAAGLDDEEAPDAAPVDTPPAPEEPSSGGPKTPTDKIVDKFMLLDTDGSKSVSMQEYLIMVQQRVKARFEAMDADGNGEVSEGEYRQFWKSRMAKWYRLKR